ncbi:cysteine--tRNA ligase [Wohlfahrtiimonas chitiniclastica]|uniref:cysteine--tRNA ligase n=1 Tax=Wohlfahrtiimonas chitiniclastica TaxID=400946 RepID=UPI0007B69642|nr:cysteine--tRNA ligase [Wohlfahrtiimonas chitiniclastica]KZX36351.1 cysteine--tRNA ligase [Wohlfahrtiimonas chitiniclastica]
MLSIFNSLTRQQEDFIPIEPNKIRMYVCGMTVYDYCHIGHARSLIAFDMIRRYLMHKGFDVHFVRNITDIDDKIIKRANERGITIHELTDEFINAMHEDCAKLNVLTPDSEPRATDAIAGMIELIEGLISKGLAYAVPDGDVYYRVRSFKDYGKLSNQNIDELRSGERVEVQSDKEDPLDFVLWKRAKAGEPYWDSPWGQGRPGWHIECSVMSKETLGNHFDIHGGGMDLKFPHHECEIAQSEGYHEEPMANYWMHNGFININNEKMSKSLGNFFTIRDVLKYFPAEVLRFFMLNSHYRTHVNYSDDLLNQSWNGLRRLYTALNDAPEELPAFDPNHPIAVRFSEVMDDDFNTPQAIDLLFEAANLYNKHHDPKDYVVLKTLGNVLGLLEANPDHFLKSAPNQSDDDTDLIEALIAERNEARANKNWAESDRIRDELKARNVVLEDKQGKTTWRRETQ